MAEGLGLAASAIAVIQITGTIVSMTYHYGRDCWDAKDDCKRMTVDTKALHNVLETAVALVEDDAVAHRFPNVRRLLQEDPDGFLEVCQDEVTKVETTLRKEWNSWCDNRVRGMFALAKWPLKKKRLESALEGIHSLHEAISEALALDTGRDVANIHTAVDRLEDNMSNLATVVDEIKHMAAVTGETATAIMDTTTRIESITIDIRQEQAIAAARAEEEREQQQRQHREAEAKKRDQERHKKIIRRLEPKDYERAALNAKHSGLCNGRDPQTSSWLLDGESLTAVLQSNASPRTLWIKGKAGCGKSMLAAAVIEHVKKENNAVLAFFYFDFNSSAASTPDTMLRSLVARLASACATLPAVLDQFANNHLDEDGRVPQVDAVVQLLHDLVEHVTGNDSARVVVLVIDALDECVDRDELLGILEKIRGWHLPLCIILTSHDLPDIAERLHGGTAVVIDADSERTSSDISIFVKNQLETSNFTKWSPVAKKKITAALVSGAGGMFRWVACQLEMLRDCVTEGDLDRALASLPCSLSATYTAALRRVKAVNRPRVLRLLFWMVVESSPPTLEEASHYLAVNLNDKEAGPDGEIYFKDEERPARPLDIALLCPTLIQHQRVAFPPGYVSPIAAILRAMSQEPRLHLAHSTVKDYLECPNALLEVFGPDITAVFTTNKSTPPPIHPANLLGVAHGYACKMLLGYVLSWRAPCMNPRDWPLHQKARKWPLHFHAICAANFDDEELRTMVHSLFQESSGKSAYVFANFASLVYTGSTFQGRRCSDRLVVACAHGLENIVEQLFKELVDGPWDADVSPKTVDEGHTSLADCVAAAVRWNHVGVLSFLLKSTRPADLGPAKSLLFFLKGNVEQNPEAYSMLISHFLSTDQLSARDLDDIFPFITTEACSVLFDAGAKPDWTYLSRLKHLPLLERGLQVAEDKTLQRAALQDRRIWKASAPFLKNLASRLPGLAFSWAARTERCRELAWPALCPAENSFSAACMSGQVATARHMVETGAVDMYAPLWSVAGWDAYPLFVAVFAQQVEIAAACLTQGAPVDQRGSTYSLYRPLSLAVLAGDISMVRLLVEHGAALDTVCSEYGTPLQTSAYMGNKEITKLLLSRHGVEVDQTAAPKSPPWEIAHHYAYWTPLRIAHAEGHIGVAALLVRRNPDAVWADCPADVYLGADGELAESWDTPRSLLMTASTEHGFGFLWLFLEAQIHIARGRSTSNDEPAEEGDLQMTVDDKIINARQDIFVECCDAAFKNGYIYQAQVLLTAGGVYAKTRCEPEFLHAAIEHRRVYEVKPLLEAGADANALYKSRRPLTVVLSLIIRERDVVSDMGILRILMAYSANIELDDDVCEAFHGRFWEFRGSEEADGDWWCIEILLTLLGCEELDLRDTATVVSRLVVGRSRSKYVALLLLRFINMDEIAYGDLGPEHLDMPLDEESISAGVKQLWHRTLLLETHPIAAYPDERWDHIVGFRGSVPDSDGESSII